MTNNEFTPEEERYCMSIPCFNRVHGLAGKDNPWCVACLDRMKQNDEKVTNSEKFREVFGFKPAKRLCVAPQKVCDEQALKHIGETVDECVDCPFRDFWKQEYKPCFRLDERFE